MKEIDLNDYVDNMIKIKIAKEFKNFEKFMTIQISLDGGLGEKVILFNPNSSRADVKINFHRFLNAVIDDLDYLPNAMESYKKLFGKLIKKIEKKEREYIEQSRIDELEDY